MAGYEIPKIITDAQNDTYAQRTANHVRTEGGVWVPQAATDEGAIKTEVTGSNIVIAEGGPHNIVASGNFRVTLEEKINFDKIIISFRFNTTNPNPSVNVIFSASVDLGNTFYNTTLFKEQDESTYYFQGLREASANTFTGYVKCPSDGIRRIEFRNRREDTIKLEYYQIIGVV